MPDSDPPKLPPFAELLASFAGGIVDAQSQLDAEWVDSLHQYARALPAGCAEWQAVTRLLAPARQVISSAVLETRAACAKEASGEFTIRVQPVPLSYERKFEHTAFIAAHISMTVVAHSAAPNHRRVANG